MKQLALAMTLLALPAVGRAADDVWRWSDAQGKVHYTNIQGAVPEGASKVTTKITIVTDRLPGAPEEPGLMVANGQVVDAPVRTGSRSARTSKVASKWLPDAPQVYDEERRRFGCFAAGTLFFGGFSHADDISPALNCTPYQIGPEAWLNSAKAELAVRQNGISMRDMLRLYDESRAAR